MARNRIQKLLITPEYIEFKDSILAEAAFIELDKCGEAIKQVFLAITENCFILACDVPPDYSKFPCVKYNPYVDLDTDGLEIELLVPIGFLEISVDETTDRLINVDMKNGSIRHFMMSEIWGRARRDWLLWKDALISVQSDPYSYTKCLFKNYTIPDDVYDNAIIARRRSEIIQKNSRSLEAMTNKVMEKMYEIHDEIQEKRADRLKNNMTKLREGILNRVRTEDEPTTRDNESQTEVSHGKTKQKKSLKTLCRGLCFGGSAKQRPP